MLFPWVNELMAARLSPFFKAISPSINLAVRLGFSLELGREPGGQFLGLGCFSEGGKVPCRDKSGLHGLAKIERVVRGFESRGFVAPQKLDIGQRRKLIGGGIRVLCRRCRRPRLFREFSPRRGSGLHRWPSPPDPRRRRKCRSSGPLRTPSIAGASWPCPRLGERLCPEPPTKTGHQLQRHPGLFGGSLKIARIG